MAAETPGLLRAVVIIDASWKTSEYYPHYEAPASFQIHFKLSLIIHLNIRRYIVWDDDSVVKYDTNDDNNNNNSNKSLGIEIQRMWNPKCTIIPVIIGASGIVTRSLKKNLEAVPGNIQ